MAGRFFLRGASVSDERGDDIASFAGDCFRSYANGVVSLTREDGFNFVFRLHEAPDFRVKTETRVALSWEMLEERHDSPLTLCCSRDGKHIWAYPMGGDAEAWLSGGAWEYRYPGILFSNDWGQTFTVTQFNHFTGDVGCSGTAMTLDDDIPRLLHAYGFKHGEGYVGQAFSFDELGGGGEVWLPPKNPLVTHASIPAQMAFYDDNCAFVLPGALDWRIVPGNALAWFRQHGGSGHNEVPRLFDLGSRELSIGNLAGIPGNLTDENAFLGKDTDYFPHSVHSLHFGQFALTEFPRFNNQGYVSEYGIYLLTANACLPLSRNESEPVFFAFNRGKKILGEEGNVFVWNEIDGSHAWMTVPEDRRYNFALYLNGYGRTEYQEIFGAPDKWWEREVYCQEIYE